MEELAYLTWEFDTREEQRSKYNNMCSFTWFRLSCSLATLNWSLLLWSFYWNLYYYLFLSVKGNFHFFLFGHKHYYNGEVISTSLTTINKSSRQRHREKVCTSNFWSFLNSFTHKIINKYKLIPPISFVIYFILSQ